MARGCSLASHTCVFSNASIRLLLHITCAEQSVHNILMMLTILAGISIEGCIPLLVFCVLVSGTICLRVGMWSLQDFPFLKLACSSLMCCSSALVSLFKIILLNTLLVSDRRVIPLQLLQLNKSHFLGNFSIGPIFQSSGVFSVS